MHQRRKKILVCISIIAILSLFACALVACNDDDTQMTKDINVIFDLNDGSGQTIEQTINPQEQLSYTPPTHEGYVFLRWTLDEEGNNEFSIDDLKNGVILYAQWQIKTYTVKFYDEDLNLISSVTVNHGASATPPTQEEIEQHLNEGRVFIGWNQSLDNITQNLSVQMVTDEVINKYSVVFMDGDKQVALFEDGSAGTLIPKPDNPQKRDGFRFEGWKTQEGKLYTEENVFSADETYYSAWSLQDPTAPQIDGVDSVVYGNTATFNLNEDSLQEYADIIYTYEWLDKDNNVLTSGNTYQTSVLNAGEYSFKIRVTASCDGYDSTSAISTPKTLIVEKAAITVTLSNATITYGDSLPQTNDMTFKGFVNGDDESVVDMQHLTFVTAYEVGKNADKYNLTATGFQAQNYEFTVLSATLTVEKKQVSITKTFEKIYDGKVASIYVEECGPTAEGVEGLLEGHTIFLILTTTGANVGEYTFGSQENGITRSAKIVIGEPYNDCTSNYDISITASARILPADIRYTLPSETRFTFNNEGHSSAITLTSTECQVEYSADNKNFSAQPPQFVNAGTYKVYAKISGSNYNTVETSYDITIDKQSIYIKPDDQPTTYGDTSFVLDQNAYTYDCETYGAQFDVKLTSEYTVGNNVGRYKITATATEKGTNNFDIRTTIPGFVIVRRAILNVTLKDVTLNYGDAFTPSVDEHVLSIDGLYGDDSIPFSTLTTDYDKSSSTVDKTYKISLGTLLGYNYSIESVTGGTITVLPRDLSISIDTATVTYGEAFDLNSLEVVKDVLADNGDEFSNVVLSYEGDEYSAGANAGLTFTITATATILNGEEDRTQNYNITIAKGTLSVEKRPVSIKVNDVSVLYGESISIDQYGYTVTSGSFYNAESIKVNYLTSYIAGCFGDNYTVRASINDANHDIDVTVGDITIAKRDVHIAYSANVVQTKLGIHPTVNIGDCTVENKYNGDKFGGTLQTISADNGEYVYGKNGFEWATALNVTNANGEDVTAMYNATYDISLVIADSIIEHSATAQNATYNGSEISLDGVKVTESNLKNVLIKYTTDKANGYTLDSAPSFTNAGEYTVYYLITADDKTPTEGNYTVAIAKKNATITADDKSVTYGELAPEYTFSQSGIIDGDSITVTLECAYKQGNAVGSYDIVVKYEENANYNITAVNGTLNVTQRTVNVALQDVKVTYGADFVPTNALATTEGVYGDDDIQLALSTSYDKATASVDKAESITATIGNANYTLGEVTGGNITILARAITLAVNNATVEYGNNFDLSTLTTNKDSVTLANGDTFGEITFSYVDNAYTQGANAGLTFAITASVEIVNGDNNRTQNYNITVTNGTLTVEQRLVEVNTNDIAVTYGDALDTSKHGYTVASGSFYNGSSVNVTYETEYVAGKYGAYTIKAVFDETTKANHKISQTDGNVIINAREVTVSYTETVAMTGEAYEFDLSKATLNNAYNGDTIQGRLRTASADKGVYTANGALSSDMFEVISNVYFKSSDGSIINNNAYSVKYELNIEITEEKILYTPTGVNTTYDATAHQGSVAVTDESITEYTIKYAQGEKPSTHDGYTLDTAPSFVSAGAYTVYFLITAEGKTPTEGSYTVNIAKAKITFTAHTQTAVYGDEFALDQTAYDVTGDKYGANFEVVLTTDYTVGKDVGNYQIVISAKEKDTQNFEISVANSTLTVSAKAVTVTASDVIATYGTLENMPSFEVDVASAKEFITLSATGYNATSNVGEYTITATSSTQNYTVNLVSAYKVTVQKRAITLTADNNTMVYGNAIPTLTYTATNLIAGDKLNGISLALTKDGNTVAETTPNAGEYVITLSVDENANPNYAITTQVGKLIVDKRQVTVNTPNINVTYGNSISDSQWKTNGYTYAENSLEFIGAKPIPTAIETTYQAGDTQGTTLTLTFAQDANHLVTVNEGNISITARNITVEGTFEFVQNDGVFHTIDLSTITLSNVFGDDKLVGKIKLLSDQADEFRVTTLDKFATTQDIAITNANGNDVTDLYNIAYNLSVKVVVKHVENISVPTQTAYNGDEQSKGITLPADMPEEVKQNAEIKYAYEKVQDGATTASDGIVYDLTSVNLTDAGTYKVYYRIVADGYTTTTGEYIVTIAKINVAIKATDQTTVYGESFNPGSYTIVSGEILDKDKAGFAISVTTETTAPSVEVYPNALTISYVENKNYNVTTTPGTWTVTQKAVTVTAQNFTVTYGNALPTLNYTSANGIIAGDTTTRVELVCDYTAGNNVGAYAITAKISDTTNYTVALANSYTLTVTPRVVNVVANTTSVTYGTLPNLTYATSNVYNGYTVKDVTLAVMNSAGVQVADTSKLAVGDYTVEITVGDTNANYTFETQTCAFAVSKATLTATIQLASNRITYGEDMPTANISYSGFKYGDDENVINGTQTLVCNYITKKQAGTFTVGIEGLSADNYTISVAPTSLTVNKATLTVTPISDSIDFGDELPTFECRLDGLLDDDKANESAIKESIIYSCTDSAGNEYPKESHAGKTYTISVNANTVLDNYNVIAGSNAELTINVLDIHVTITGKTTVVYGTDTINFEALAWDKQGYITDFGNWNIGATFAIVEGRYIAGSTPAGEYTDAVMITSWTNKDFNIKTQDYGTLVVERSSNVQINHTGSLEANWNSAGAALQDVINASSTNPEDSTVTYDITSAPFAQNGATKVTDGGVYNVTIVSKATDNYVSVTKDVVVKINAATIGSTYYTVEGAISKANDSASAQTVTLQGNAFISESVTVGTNVTFILPGKEADALSTTIGSPTYNGTSSRYVESDGTKILYRLTIPDKKALTISGTVLVNGMLGPIGGPENYQGHTCGVHSQIINNGDIIVNGILDVRGYILGSGNIVLNKNSTTYSPFVVRDFNGGTYTLKVYSSVAPFSQYEMPNIQCPTRTYSGALHKAYCQLYAGSQVNSTVIDMYGSDGVLKIQDGGYIDKTYKPNKTTLTLVGNISLGSLSLSIKINNYLPFPITVSMSKVYFPIPYLYDIIIGDGKTPTSVTAGYKYKLMTGAKCVVHENATLSLTGSNVVYDEFVDTKPSGIPNLYPSKSSAVLEVNGTLKVTGSFGGKITSKNPNAQIDFTGATASAESQEIIADYKKQPIGGPAVYVDANNITYTYNGSTWIAAQSPTR